MIAFQHETLGFQTRLLHVKVNNSRQEYYSSAFIFCKLSSKIEKNETRVASSDHKQKYNRNKGEQRNKGNSQNSNLFPVKFYTRGYST